MTENRDDGAGLRRLPPEDAADMARRVTDQAEREDEFDRAMRPKPAPTAGENHRERRTDR